MARLSLKLLGLFQAAVDGEPLTNFRTKGVQALLIYLACQPESHRRESLMSLLWPEIVQSSAQNSLRQALYQLRQTIPEVDGKESGEPVPFLIADRQIVQVNPDATYGLDVDAFERLFKGPQEAWPEAAALYRGDFLSDFYLPDSAPFEEWAAARRADLKRQALEALDTLTAAAMQANELEPAEKYARQQLSIDNLRERAHRQLMEILVLSGRRSQALAQYEECRNLLAEELDAEPSPKTKALYERIRSAELGTAFQGADRVRGYELKEEIGAGAFGVVYRALQPGVGREVAIKIISPDHANRPDFIRRFEAEARFIARLEHPYIVPLYDYWREPDGAYLVMRYLRGGGLGDLLKQGPCDLETAVRIMDQITAALAAAHRRHIVHRDIKPANILLDVEGNAYLSDFGIAKELTADRRLTQAGGLLGSPAYLSPEQALGQEITPQADIYSLGVVLYEMLTGAHPFADTPVSDLPYRHAHEPLPSTRETNPDLPPLVDSIIQQATAKTPAGRFSDARALALALADTVRGKAIPVAIDLDAAELVNPYKGLRPFEEADAADFFGREALVEELLAQLSRSQASDGRFLAVVGPSGSGKSSAVKAGLLPALRRGALPGSEKWFVAEMVPGTHPLEELEIALWSVAVDPPPYLVEPMQKDIRGMLRTIRRILPFEKDAQLLLVIDQFEELFTLVEEEERRTFFLESLLTAVSDPRSPLRVVITLRADFYDRPLQHQRLGQLIKDNTEIILPLTAEELTWAIQEPARRVGVGFEKGLALAIVGDLTDQPGALPLLQYALTELFDNRHDHQLTRAVYDEIGGVQGALGRRAEELYTELDQEGQDSACQLFLRLVTLGEGAEDTRRRVLRSELEALQPKAEFPAHDSQVTIDNSPLTNVIDTFGHARLLTFDRDPLSRAPTVEVAHEALLREWRRLRGWLDQSRSDVRLQRMLASAAAEWAESQKDPGFLLRDARLDQFAGWAEDTTVALTQEERSFLQASIAAREARLAAEEARRQKELETARKLAEMERIRAQEQEANAVRLRQEIRRAEEQASIGLAALAREELEGANPERGVLLALAALDEYPYTPQAESALAQAVYGTHPYTTMRSVRNRVTAVEFSSDGALIAGGEWDIVVWDAISGEIVTDIDTGLDGSWPTSLDWLSDNSELLVARQEFGGIVNVWNVATGEERLRYEAHEGAVNSVYASADDRLALSASADGTARIWLIESGETVQIFTGHEDEVNEAIWSPDERQVATASSDGTIRIWNVETGAEQMKIDAHLGGVRALSWSSDGARLATAGNDGLGRVWDATTGKLLLTLIGHDTLISDIAWSPDNSLLATAGSDGLVRVWESRAGLEQYTLAGPAAQLMDIDWSPDGQRLVVTQAGQPQVWDVNTPIVRLVGYGTGEYAVVQTNWPYWSPDSAWVGAGGHNDNTYRLWDLGTGELIKTYEGVLAGFGAPNPAGTEIFLVNPPRIINLEMGDVRPVSVPDEFPDENLFAIEWSPDGSLITLQPPHPIYPVYDAESLELLFQGRRRDCGFLLPGYFSPDNKYLAQTCTFSGEFTSVRITESLSGKVVKELEGHTDWTFFASWSPDGSKLATGSGDGTIRVWDVATGETLTVFTGHTALPASMDWSPNGTRLVSGDDAGNVLVWDAKTGGVVNRYNVGGSVFGTAWSPDGTRALITGFFDAPDIRPVWQSTEELIEYATECCVFRELTAEERAQFGLPQP